MIAGIGLIITAIILAIVFVLLAKFMKERFDEWWN
jgi:hypothetical protein